MGWDNDLLGTGCKPVHWDYNFSGTAAIERGELRLLFMQIDDNFRVMGLKIFRE